MKLSQFNLGLIRSILLVNVGFLIISCGGGGDDPEPDPEPVVDNPTAATLVFPKSNSECTEGTDITATESTVEFKWTGALHTDSYNLMLKDLSSGTTVIKFTDNTKLSVKIKRGKPYSWHVISKSKITSNTAKSETSKFYNAGEGISSYAPFPAELVSPNIREGIANDNVTLKWTGNDIDNDIESYTVYFGEVNPPTVEYKTNFTESNVKNVPIVAGKTYYWYVVTKDVEGNTSDSDIFWFKGI